MYNIKTMAYQGCDGRGRGGRERDRLRGRERERREAGGERGEAGGDVLAGSRPAQDQEKIAFQSQSKSNLTRVTFVSSARVPQNQR